MAKMFARSRSAAIKSAFLRAKAAAPDGWLSLAELRQAVAEAVPDATHDEIIDALKSLARRWDRRTAMLLRQLEE